MSEPLKNEDAHLHTEQLDGLVAAAGVDGARAVLDAFWRTTSQLLESMNMQVSDNTLHLAGQTAHAVKGSAANVGAQRLAASAARFETACHAGDQAAIEEALHAIAADFAAVREHFEEHLARA